MICLSLTGRTLAENLEYIRISRSNIRICELRADFLDDSEWKNLYRFPSMVDLPVILTVRKECDGGCWKGNEAERLKIIASALEGGYTFVDLEEDLPGQEWEESWLDRGGRIIRSFHDFNSVPGDLPVRMKSMIRRPSEIVKAAVTPNNTAELISIFNTAEELSGMEKILLGMGDIGFPTRVLAKRMGSFLTFTSPAGASAAPGHIDPETLADVYRYYETDSETRLFGIIGKPVMHTKSPQIHNSGYSRGGVNCLYVPFEIEDPGVFLEWAREYGFEGFSVTVPHKETVIPLLAETDPGVKAVGSCNTIVLEKGGWHGYNTDVPGFLEPLIKIWGREGFSGKKAAVVGAGGAARAVVFALKTMGMDVDIYNRTASRARILAELFNASWKKLSDGSEIEAADLVVQTTVVGMAPHYPGNPVPEIDLKSEMICYDIIYAPENTEFLISARSRGCTVVRGMEMLLSQGMEQYRLFTGTEYPEA